MTDTEIRQAATHFYSALNHLYQGNRDPMEEIWSHGPDITCLNGSGNRLVGWDEIKEFWHTSGDKVRTGQIEPKNLLIRVAGDIAYTVCREEGRYSPMRGKAQKICRPATAIFRREGWAWKVVHYHADGKG